VSRGEGMYVTQIYYLWLVKWKKLWVANRIKWWTV